MRRMGLCLLLTGLFGAWVATAFAGQVQAHSTMVHGLLAWTTPLLLTFSFALSIGMGVKRNLDGTAGPLRHGEGDPHADLNLKLTSKWGWRQ